LEPKYPGTVLCQRRQRRHIQRTFEKEDTTRQIYQLDRVNYYSNSKKMVWEERFLIVLKLLHVNAVSGEKDLILVSSVF